MLVRTVSSGKAIGQCNVVERYFLEIRFLLPVEDVRQVSNRQNPSKVGIKLTLQISECLFPFRPFHHVAKSSYGTSFQCVFGLLAL